jgi:hypothetical protein
MGGRSCLACLPVFFRHDPIQRGHEMAKYLVKMTIRHSGVFIPVGYVIDSTSETIQIGKVTVQNIPTSRLQEMEKDGTLQKTKISQPLSPIIPPAPKVSVETKKENKPDKSRVTGQIKQPKSVWTVDKDKLEGLSLQELNDMVLERDKDRVPFTQSQDAIDLLTMDAQ